MFISIVDVHDSLSTSSLVLMYARTGSKDWRLFGLRSGLYKVLGNDAITWYRQAEGEYVKGADMDAYLHQRIALELLKPGAAFIHYHKEREILDFKTDLSNKLDFDYKIPATAEYVPGTPQLFDISTRLYDGKLCPVVYVKTALPLSDTSALSKQCDEIHAGLDALFRKLNRNEHLLYEVYGETADPADPGPGIVFVKHALKKYWQYRD
jgi:hypothetical protein